VLDIEKLWSYLPHGGYLLVVGWWWNCLTPHPNIHFKAAFGGLKTDGKANVWELEALPRC